MKYVFCIIMFLMFTPTFIAAESGPSPVFYRNEGVSVEFRILLEDQEKIPWILMWDREGLPQRVSKEIVIGTDDIAGFTIDDYKSDWDDDHGVMMHFEPSSWEKIRETTVRLRGIRLAFIRNGQLYSSPKLLGTLTRYTGVYLGEIEASVEALLKGLHSQSLPDYLHSETIYERFLLDWVDSHPEDWEAIRELVDHYFTDKNNPKCNKALTHAQRFVKATPKNSHMQIRLIQCYQFIGKHEKALSVGMQTISHASSLQQAFLHRLIGESQYKMGNKKKAVKSVEASLDILKQMKSLITDGTILPLGSIQENGKVIYPKLEEMIQEIQDRMNYFIAH